ncbi:hypothetical protein CDA63_18660 [Hymenobacter amundsenii]|uniref:Uncharacterized protein n=1 Tax=Hymenobacter amundsenii TaxID=2006685 RepID=A0A246FGB6_9BACT|nr:hypothetical protein CDA63_18660 [Hymenobacter amundsenii]
MAAYAEALFSRALPAAAPRRASLSFLVNQTPVNTVYFTDRSGVEQPALQSLLAFEHHPTIGQIAVLRWSS